MIEQRGFAKVAQLATHFHVSEVTVRADLDALAESHAIQRVHGGAIAGLHSAALELPFEQSLRTSWEEKRRIGRAAAALVKSNEAVILDVGTTTTAIARALITREELENVVVITNALNIALEFEASIPRFTVIVTGGTLRPMQHSLVDPMADAVLDRIRAQIAFVGCNGIDAVAGVTNVNLPEADMKRRMLATATRAVVVADSSKIGVVQLSRVVPLSDIDTLVTGAAPDDPRLEELRDAGLEVLLSD
ncbi:transcriptional regulator [Pseudolysinimonas yzui]|uniref:Transcriptional regulator n=2 Tax=Pseudolysinimonas yzui TaxID=2708254 RepID=A0A8J3GSF7_9MICO|nr:transcriptional regulator [Pseudolysinimonas yzui]